MGTDQNGDESGKRMVSGCLLYTSTDKGRTKQTIRNCVTVLQNDLVLKKAIKRNELSGRMDIVKEVPWERRNNSPTVTDTDEYNLKMYLEEHYEITSERVIKAGIDIVSNENKYHPIRDYMESLVWDEMCIRDSCEASTDDLIQL